jgi:hypothetical protein
VLSLLDFLGVQCVVEIVDELADVLVEVELYEVLDDEGFDSLHVLSWFDFGTLN